MTTEVMPDRVAALIAFLQTNAAVAELTAGRVYGGELPESEQRHQPRPAVVVSPGGGGSGSIGNAFQEYGDRSVDLRLYGKTPGQADLLWRTVAPALKHLRREVHAGCLLHWAKPSVGEINLRDPNTQWPFVLASYQVLAAERAAS